VERGRGGRGRPCSLSVGTNLKGSPRNTIYGRRNDRKKRQEGKKRCGNESRTGGGMGLDHTQRKPEDSGEAIGVELNPGLKEENQAAA